MANDVEARSEVYPLLWSANVAAIADWAVATLGLTEAWRAGGGDSGAVEHAELAWSGGRVSINVKTDATRNTGPSGIALRIDDRNRVDELHARAVAGGAEITQGPEESRVAYSFTTLDPDGNQWWINAETGFLDELRAKGGSF